jgi:hypothetical protein
MPNTAASPHGALLLILPLHLPERNAATHYRLTRRVFSSRDAFSITDMNGD